MQLDLKTIIQVVTVILSAMVFLILFVRVYLERNEEVKRNIYKREFGAYDYEKIIDESTASFLNEQLEKKRDTSLEDENNFREFDA